MAAYGKTSPAGLPPCLTVSKQRHEAAYSILYRNITITRHNLESFTACFNVRSGSTHVRSLTLSVDLKPPPQKGKEFRRLFYREFDRRDMRWKEKLLRPERILGRLEMLQSFSLYLPESKKM